jgi:hypothetical protein
MLGGVGIMKNKSSIVMAIISAIDATYGSITGKEIFVLSAILLILFVIWSEM